KPKPGVIWEVPTGVPPASKPVAKTGEPFKLVLTFPMLTPAFTPAYQPVQVGTGAAGGGALAAISAANANPLPAKLKTAPARPDMSLFRIGPTPDSEPNFPLAIYAAWGQRPVQLPSKAQISGLCCSVATRGKCPLWVKSRHRSTSTRCPLYPQ